MADPELYEYPSPLEGYENAPPLPDALNEDGKSFVNPARTDGLSTAYEKFSEPIDNGIRGGFDVHIYFYHNNPEQVKYAKELWERVRREFPELRIYEIFDKPIGPHSQAMFEVDLFTPSQFGAFIPWLVINRGPLCALVHPNTSDYLRDHTQRATWMGREVPVDTRLFRQYAKEELRRREEEEEGVIIG